MNVTNTSHVLRSRHDNVQPKQPSQSPAKAAALAALSGQFTELSLQSKPMPKVSCKPAAAAQKEMQAQVVLELGLRFTTTTFDGIAANVGDLTSKINELTLRVRDPLTSDEIISVLDNARSYMQLVENVFKALGATEDYRVPKVRQRVETIKNTLCDLIDTLVLRTNALMATGHFVAGIQNATEYDEIKAQEIATLLETYETKASHILGVVHFEKDLQTAEVELDKVGPEMDPNQVIGAVRSATTAMDRTADGLQSFQTASASVNKYQNPLLTKMMQARERLAAKVGSVITNESVKKAIPEPEFQVLVQNYEAKNESAANAAVAILNPSQISLTPEQQNFVKLTNNALDEKIELPDDLKGKLNNLAARMLPLVKILADCKNSQRVPAQGDIYSLAQTIFDFFVFYQHFVKIPDQALNTSYEAYSVIRKRFQKGLDQFIIYLIKEALEPYRALRFDAQSFLGALFADVDAEWDRAHKMGLSINERATQMLRDKT